MMLQTLATQPTTARCPSLSGSRGSRLPSPSLAAAAAPRPADGGEFPAAAPAPRPADGSEFPAAVIGLLLILVGFVGFVGFVGVADDVVYPKDQLIDDARQLAAIIEGVHPDPFQHGGGRIPFFLKLDGILQSIPEAGMTQEAFTRLLRPLVASVGDSHTEIWGSFETSTAFPGGIPLVLGFVEDALYVERVASSSHAELLGARLAAVEGLSLSELETRQAQLVALENEYHVLQELATTSLWYEPYLAELIPEWSDHSVIEATFDLITRESRTVTFSVPQMIYRTTGFESDVDLPETGYYGFGFHHIDTLGIGEIGYLRIDHLTRYREDSEICVDLGVYEMSATQLAAIPSATEVFRETVLAMEERGTETLIIDLRDNDGGDSLMSDILIYFLYGSDVLQDTMTASSAAGGGTIIRYSEEYFASRPNLSLESINADRAIPIVMGGYDFSSYFGADPDRFEALKEDPDAILYPFQRAYPSTATFFEELTSGTFSAYYRPENVIVLVSPRTFSSAFTMTRDLYRAGAILVGTPSAQSSNCFGNALNWRLDNTGIEGIVSFSYFEEFPGQPELGRVLPMHHPMTYERLASYDFDPESAFLLALEVCGLDPNKEDATP